MYPWVYPNLNAALQTQDPSNAMPTSRSSLSFTAPNQHYYGLTSAL